MHRRIWWLSILLVIGWTLHAEGVAEVCGDARGVTEFRVTAINPKSPQDGCFFIPDDVREAQITLWNTVPDRRHLQVSNGLLTRKSAVEIQAIADSDATAEAKQAELERELTVNTLCNTLDFAEVEARIDAATKPEHIKMILKKLARCLIAARKSQS